MDEEKDHLVSGTLIQVMEHQCTNFLVPTKINITMRRCRPMMLQMKKGIWAKKVWESSGRTETAFGKAYVRSMKEMLRSRGAMVVSPSQIQSGVFLNVRSRTLDRCL